MMTEPLDPDSPAGIEAARALTAAVVMVEESIRRREAVEAMRVDGRVLAADEPVRAA